MNFLVIDRKNKKQRTESLCYSSNGNEWTLEVMQMLDLDISFNNCGFACVSESDFYYLKTVGDKMQQLETLENAYWAVYDEGVPDIEHIGGSDEHFVDSLEKKIQHTIYCFMHNDY